MQHYSFARLIREGFKGHTGWRRAWRKAALKPAYDIVIIGGGGHGLATAYYLAKHHGMRDIAVIEKGWIGGGNSGRNTTIIRSNYLHDESAAIYGRAATLWATLGRELNFNIMMSHRGVLVLAHDDEEAHQLKRRNEANRLQGIDAEWLERGDVAAFCPVLNMSREARFPIVGGALQRSGGTNRHDAVVWGLARQASAMGIDIVEATEVTAIHTSGGAVTGIQTTGGPVRAPKVAAVAAGHSSVVAAMAGIRLPIAIHPLQACVSEPIKPMLDCVIMSSAVHAYCSQSDKGELVIGAGMDSHIGYTQRGAFAIVERQLAAMIEVMPSVSRLKMMRQWGGTVDVTPDASPILSATPVKGFYVNCGWGTGGWKATPASGEAFADLLAREAPNVIAAPFGLDRFTTGRLVAEHGASAVIH